MAIQTILVAFDFSEPATRALRWADALAQASHVRLEMVHVHRDAESSRGAREGPWPLADQEERYIRFLRQELRDAARAVLRDRAELISVQVERGDPVKRLNARAEQLHADLMVIGATGKRVGERVLLGSVSESVMRTSSIPVAIVH